MSETNPTRAFTAAAITPLQNITNLEDWARISSTGPNSDNIRWHLVFYDDGTYSVEYENTSDETELIFN